MRWLRKDQPEAHTAANVDDKVALAEAALAKARADNPRVLRLTREIHMRIEENSWSPKVAAAFRVPRKR